MSFESIGARFRRLRQDRGITMKDLCHRTGYATGSLSKFESNRSDMLFMTVASMAKELGVGLDYLAYDNPCASMKEDEYAALTQAIYALGLDGKHQMADSLRRFKLRLDIAKQPEG